MPMVNVIEGIGWVETKSLRVGQLLLTKEFELVDIESITMDRTAGTPIFNISVEDNHNYFVSNSLILTHNKSCFNNTNLQSLVDEAADGTRTINQVRYGDLLEEMRIGVIDDAEIEVIIKELAEKNKKLGDKFSDQVEVLKNTSKRLQYMGRTPGKATKVGQEVKDQMFKDGKYKNIDGVEEFYSDELKKWFPIKEADMSHKVDAVSWWNKVGIIYGPKSDKVRDFMTNSKNYTLEHYSVNRSAGAKLKEKYLDPVILKPVIPNSTTPYIDIVRGQGAGTGTGTGTGTGQIGVGQIGKPSKWGNPIDIQPVNPVFEY